MSNRCRTMVAALVLGAVATPGLRAEGAGPLADPPPVPEHAWGLDVGAEYASRYLFRGVSLLADQPVLYPHVRFGLGPVAVYCYGYFGTIPGGHTFREADAGADYTFTFGERVALTVGAVTYQYNRDAERDLIYLDTYEIYGIVAIDAPLAPTISFYRDVDAVKGGFLSVGISQGVPFGDRVRLILSGSVGFDFGYNTKSVKNGTFDDVLVGADLPIRITDGFSVHAMVQHSFAERALDRGAAADPSLRPFYRDQTVVSAGLSYSF